jgi:hypothetical protein
VDQSRTKVAHRVEGGKVIGAPRKGAGVGQQQASEIVGDEGRSRKPRVTLERQITWNATAEGTGGFIAGKAARGRDTRSGWDTSRFDSDEMSPLYENRCLTVGLV